MSDPPGRPEEEQGTDPSPGQPRGPGPEPRPVDTLAEQQAMAALDALLSRMDSQDTGPASGAPPGDDVAPGERPPLHEDETPGDGWYVALEDQPSGPLAVDKLQERWSRGEIGADTLCWREGMQTWRPLSRIPALAAAIAPRPREGLRALSARAPPPEPRPSAPPDAASMLRFLADQETRAERRRQPPPPPSSGPKSVPRPPPFSESDRDRASEQEPRPRRSPGLGGARLLLALLAASMLGGAVGGWLVKLTIPPPAPSPPAPVVVVPPPPPEPAPETDSARAAALAEPPATVKDAPPGPTAPRAPAAPAAPGKPPDVSGKPPDVSGKPPDVSGKPPDVPGKPPDVPGKPEPSQNALDKEFEDVFGQ